MQNIVSFTLQYKYNLSIFVVLAGTFTHALAFQLRKSSCSIIACPISKFARAMIKFIEVCLCNSQRDILKLILSVLIYSQVSTCCVEKTVSSQWSNVNNRREIKEDYWLLNKRNLSNWLAWETIDLLILFKIKHL